MISEVFQINNNPKVTLTTYIHDIYPGMESVNERPAVLVLPGGGYRMCSDTEAEPIALAYMAEGFQAFVLRYSVEQDAKFPAPLKDAEDALELIQKRAKEWHIRNAEVAVIGFSAGGHLAASLGTMGRIRPMALVLLYAITQEMNPGIVPFVIPDTVEMVNKNTPPAFISAASQDPVVPMSNSLLFAQALDNADVPFEIHIFKDGGHGFSLAKRHVGDGNAEKESKNLASWFSLSVDWLYSIMGDFEVESISFDNQELQKCDKYTVDISLVTLWESKACREILLKYIPVLADEATRTPAMGVSIRMMERFSPDIFKDGLLEMLDEKLNKIAVE